MRPIARIIVGNSSDRDSMRNPADALAAELVDTLRDILRDANRGDKPSRRWLRAAFPAHRAFFAAVWSGQPLPTPSSVIATLRAGAATSESLDIVDRIAAKRGSGGGSA